MSSLNAAAVSGALGCNNMVVPVAVLLGAFGAHGMKGRLSPDMMKVWETGVHYHMYHSIALFILGVFEHNLAGPSHNQQNVPKFITTTRNLWVSGIVLFSGSLYLMCLTDVKKLGAVTPFGGVLLTVGWLSLLKRY